MEKEEILRRARKEGNAEYEEQIQGRILRYSVLAIVGLCGLFWLVRAGRAWAAGMPQVNAWDYPAIATGYGAFVYLWMYRRLGRRMDLLCGVCCLLGFVIFGVQFWLHL